MEKGIIATNWLIIGFAIGLGTWQSMMIGAILGIVMVRQLK